MRLHWSICIKNLFLRLNRDNVRLRGSIDGVTYQSYVSPRVLGGTALFPTPYTK
jgi:hypothetical protein